jgi:hypothetical protein
LQLLIVSSHSCFLSRIRCGLAVVFQQPPKDKDGFVKFLSDSFAYCAGIIPSLTMEQMEKRHSSPDGNLPGREVLLAMYIHVAHHRGQAEIYLRDKGIRPPGYRI